MTQTTTTTDWQARALEAERKANEAWEQYHKLAAEVETYKRESNKLRALESSISWKITSPLRFSAWTARVFKENLPKLIERRKRGR